MAWTAEKNVIRPYFSIWGGCLVFLVAPRVAPLGAECGEGQAVAASACSGQYAARTREEQSQSVQTIMIVNQDREERRSQVETSDRANSRGSASSGAVVSSRAGVNYASSRAEMAW